MTRKSRLGSLGLASALILAACASGPQIPTAGVNQVATPAQAVAEIETLRGQEVLWGGMIVNSTNLEDATRLEVLAYPLDGLQKPEVSEQPTGRFLALESGYLETVDYQQGRLVTVKGTLAETREGEIGEADYTYPVVQSDQLYLWPEEDLADDGWGGVNFGIGIGVIF